MSNEQDDSCNQKLVLALFHQSTVDSPRRLKPVFDWGSKAISEISKHAVLSARVDFE